MDALVRIARLIRTGGFSFFDDIRILNGNIKHAYASEFD